MKNWKRSVEWCRLNTICSSTAPELLSQLLLQSPALSSNPSIPLDPQITKVLKATLTKTRIFRDWALNGSFWAQNQPQRLCLQPQLTSELQTKQGGLWEHSELTVQFLLYSDLCSWSTTSFATNTSEIPVAEWISSQIDPFCLTNCHILSTAAV